MIYYLLTVPFRLIATIVAFIFILIMVIPYTIIKIIVDEEIDFTETEERFKIIWRER